MLYIILQVIGLGIVNYCLVQSELNNIAEMYNGTGIGGFQYQQPNQYQQVNNNDSNNGNMQ